MTHLLAFLIFIPLLFSTPAISFRDHIFTIANQNGDYSYISTAPNTVTRYELAQSNAYLAHNPGSGSHFAELHPGDIVVAGKMYTVERIDYYRVSGSDYDRYQATNSPLIIEGAIYTNVETGAVYDEAGLWTLYYTDPDLLILQTCTTGYDGRMFVVGE